MEDFNEFNDMYNEDGSFNYDSLGAPDETNEFENNGMTFTERIWRKDGRELKHLEVKGGITPNVINEESQIGDLISRLKILDQSSELIDPKDLSEAFKFRKTLPLNFLNMLQVGAERYSNMFDTELFKRREESVEDKIRRLEDKKMEVVNEQRYEDAARFKREIDELKKERDNGS
jgi:hypothetical protein